MTIKGSFGEGTPSTSDRGTGTGSVASVTNGAERTRWKLRGDRVVDENPRIRLSVASLEIPDGTVFDQYVSRAVSLLSSPWSSDAVITVLLQD